MRDISFVFSFIFLSLLLGIVSAQLGEVAGQPTLNVPVGSSATANIIILNSGSTPIPFKVILPSFKAIPNNVTPSVTAYPMNGTLAPNSQQTILLTVSMPGSDKPGLSWQGVLQIVETSTINASSGGMGAVITAGVAKIVTVNSIKPIGLPFVYYLLIAAVVIVVALLAVYAVVRRRRMQPARRIVKIPAGTPAAAHAASRAGASAYAARTTKRRVARKPARKPAAKAKGGAKATARKKAAQGRKTTASRRRTRR